MKTLDTQEAQSVTGGILPVLVVVGAAVILSGCGDKEKKVSRTQSDCRKNTNDLGKRIDCQTTVRSGGTYTH